MAWEAAIHEHAAWRARRKAWVAMAGADGAAGAAGAGGGSAADAQGRMDSDEAGRALEAMSQAAASMRRAARRFMQSSEMKEAAGDAKMRSSAAHERAGEAERAELMREWAENAHKSALDGARMSASVADDAKEIVKDAEWVAAGAAEWSSDGPDRGGIPGSLAAAQGGVWENAKRRRTGPARMAAIAKKGERAAAKVRRMTATVAERAAAAAADAASRERAGPDIEEAEAAWKGAMSSAGMADAGKGSRRGRAARGAGGRRIKVASGGSGAQGAAAWQEGPRPRQCGPPASGKAAGAIERREGGAKSGHGSGGAETTAAAVWEAAGDAMAWAASMHDHSAWTERSMGWAARAEAHDAVGRAAEGLGRAIDGQGRVDADAMGQMAGMLRHAADAWGRAADAFVRTRKLSEAGAKKEWRAARAYMRAANQEYRVGALERTIHLYNYALAAAELATGAFRGSIALLKDAAKVADGADRWSAAGYTWDIECDAPSSLKAGAREDARRAGARSAAMGGRAKRTARLVAEMQKMAEAAARRSAARAEAAHMQADLDVQKAAAAWKRAMAAGNTAGQRKRAGRGR